MDRDLGTVIEEALSAYLEPHAWQVAHIEEGLRQADAGEFASEAEIAEAFTPMAALTIKRTRQAVPDVYNIHDLVAANSPRRCEPRATESFRPSLIKLPVRNVD